MALISMAVYDTENNSRTFTQQSIESLVNTVDFSRHRLAVYDNGSKREVQEYLKSLLQYPWFQLILGGKNLGTARAINTLWEKFRQPDEVAVKMDNDVVIHTRGWLDLVEEVFVREPNVGICGLKRKDLDERPGHPEKHYKSELIMLPHEKGQRWLIVEKVNHVMGTCEAFNPALLKRVGYLYQFGIYGYDDSIISYRSKFSGYLNVFLHGVEIDHIDPGGTDYLRWKQKYATEHRKEFDKLISDLFSGKRSMYFGPYDEH